MASWWCMIHGYRHPVLDAALKQQVDSFSHVMFGGLTHEPAIRLASRLVEISPAGIEHVFFCDSGSVSVEVAIKLALQYQVARGREGRTRMLTVRGGYHGDTFAPMSVCDPVNGMHSLFTGALKEQVFGPQPPAGFDRAEDDPEYLAWAAAMRQAAAEHARSGGGDHRRADPAGRGWDVSVQPCLPEAAAGAGRRARVPADPGRDRYWLRPDRDVLRLRACLGRAGHPLRRQGAHRRLPVDGGNPLYYGRRAHGVERSRRGADAWADLHGEPACLRCRLGEHRLAVVAGLGRAGCFASRPGCRPVSLLRRPCPG